MELIQSNQTAGPADLRARYEFRETRAAVDAADPTELFETSG